MLLLVGAGPDADDDTNLSAKFMTKDKYIDGPVIFGDDDDAK